MVAVVILMVVILALVLRLLVLEIDLKVLHDAERITGGKIEKIRRQIENCKKDD